jgi:hypothetical protein
MLLGNRLHRRKLKSLSGYFKFVSSSYVVEKNSIRNFGFFSTQKAGLPNIYEKIGLFPDMEVTEN